VPHKHVGTMGPMKMRPVTDARIDRILVGSLVALIILLVIAVA
jgi:hypothetical protein